MSSIIEHIRQRDLSAFSDELEGANELFRFLDLVDAGRDNADATPAEKRAYRLAESMLTDLALFTAEQAAGFVAFAYIAGKQNDVARQLVEGE